VEEPEVRFADAGGVRIAWEQFGSGPDVLLVPPLVSNIELVWEEPEFRRYLHYLGGHVRVTAFDKRGVGSSDRIDAPPTLAERALDITAVMDAAGLERAVVVGMSEGGLMAQLFAARHPERVGSLVLLASAPGAAGTVEVFRDETGSRGPLKAFGDRLDALVASWGHDPQLMADWFVPSRANRPAFVRWLGRLQRLTATAADLRRQLASVRHLDAADSLGQIAVPALVVHCTGDRVMPVGAAHYLAQRIPGARLVEIPGQDHFAEIGDHWQEITDAWLAFATGSPVVRSSRRRMATVVFTDLVDSTSATLAAGDFAWRELLDRRDRLAVRLTVEHRGTLVKTIGDGLLARFDTPRDALAFGARYVRAVDTLGLMARVGIHTGEVEVLDDGDVGGAAVNLAARIEHAADPGAVLVSSTVRELLLGGDVAFEPRGEHRLKGFDQPWRLYALVGALDRQ
jgi:class 3 adenylate cyclase